MGKLFVMRISLKLVISQAFFVDYTIGRIALTVNSPKRSGCLTSLLVIFGIEQMQSQALTKREKDFQW